MSRLHSLWLVALTSLVCGGCVIQSAQLDAAIGLFKDEGNAFEASGWTFYYGDYRALVYPVSLDGATLFSNEKGDRALFDGWTFRKVAWSRDTLEYKIKDDLGFRNYKFGSRQNGRHQCSGWTQEIRAELKRYSEMCLGERQYFNTVDVDNSGQIVQITQNIDGGGRI